MADDDREDTDGTPIPGPGVTAWLALAVGKPRASKAPRAPVLPRGFGPKLQALRIDVTLPEEVVLADGGILQRIEIRGLPAGVRLTGGRATSDGYWQLAPEDLYGIAAIVPEGIQLPFSVMLKGVFIGDDPETPWTELTGYEFTGDGARDVVMEPVVEPIAQVAEVDTDTASQPDADASPVPGLEVDEEIAEQTDDDAMAVAQSGQTPEEEVPTADLAAASPEPETDNDDSVGVEPVEVPHLETAPEQEQEQEQDQDHEPLQENVPSPVIDPEPDPVAEPVTMVVIDLDVSVGTDDPAVLRNITLHFTGLPNGAMLTQGHENLGRWSVPASELSALAIIIPEHTADFDLDVEMEITGAAPQLATIHVENPPQFTDPAHAFAVTLSAARDNGPTRISIYADGNAILDRVINWAAAPDGVVELLVPLTEGGMPFEVLIRYEAMGDDNGQPVLSGISMDGTDIAPTAAAITANGHMTDQGLIWAGDLVVDVRAALKSPAGDPISRLSDTLGQGTLAHEPSEMSEPATLSGIDTAVTGDTDGPEDILAPVPPVNPVHDMPPERDVSDTSSASDEDVTIEGASDRTDDDPVDDAPAGASGVLTVDATLSDLQRPAFINELRNLRDFIRTRPSDQSGEIYGRLGIDVTKWHDMNVRGPGGADVELEPRLPSLAPRGGLDNTREIVPMKLSDLNGISDVEVRISGLPPGTLLTHGRNLGGGVWRLNADECAVCALLPPIGRTQSLPVHIGWGSTVKGDASITPRKSLVFNMPVARPAFAGTDMQSMNLVLTAEDFDTGRHGALSLTVGDMPPGVLLTRGKNHGGGVWTLEANTGDQFTILAAASMSSFEVALTCVALNPATGDSTVVSRVLDVNPTKGMVRVRTELAA